MRVIAGKMRGTKLIAPDNDDIRPTTDRVKEDIFNIISPYVIDAVFLDLFAGSGAMGIEALSRGAERAVFVDRSGKSLSVASKNIKKCRCEEQCVKVRMPAERYVRQSKERFDIIFLDPPYRYEKLKNIIENIIKYDILKDDGILIVEHDRNVPLEVDGRLEKVRDKTYSLTQVEFFVLEENR